MTLKTCASRTCSNKFEPKTHNQIYCSDECCREETNRNIMDKYYEKKARLAGKERQCEVCLAKLSRYNTEKICSLCQRKRENGKVSIK